MGGDAKVNHIFSFLIKVKEQPTIKRFDIFFLSECLQFFLFAKNTFYHYGTDRDGLWVGGQKMPGVIVAKIESF